MDSGKEEKGGGKMKTDLEVKWQKTAAEIGFINDELIRCEKRMKELKRIRSEKWAIWEGMALELGYHLE